MSFRSQGSVSAYFTGLMPSGYDLSHDQPPQGGRYLFCPHYGPLRKDSYRWSRGREVYLPRSSFLLNPAGCRSRQGSSFAGMLPTSQYGNFSAYGTVEEGRHGFGAVEEVVTNRPYNPPMPTQKLFSSRRDRGRAPSRLGFFRQPSQLSWANASDYAPGSAPLCAGNGGVSKEPTQTGVEVKRSEGKGVPQATDGTIEGKFPKVVDPVITTNNDKSHHSLSGRGCPSRENDRCTADTVNTRYKSPASYDIGSAECSQSREARATSPYQGHHESVKEKDNGPDDTNATTRRGEMASDIPLSKTIGEVVHRPAHVGSAFGEGDETVPGATEPNKVEIAKPQGRRRRPSIGRSSSLHRVRGVSAINISIAEFPEAEEVQDNLEGDISKARNSVMAPGDGNGARRRQAARVAEVQDQTLKAIDVTCNGEEKMNCSASMSETPCSAVTQPGVAKDAANGSRTENRLKDVVPYPPSPRRATPHEERVSVTGTILPVMEAEKIKERQNSVEEEEQQQSKDPKPNPIKTVVLVEKVPSASTPFTTERTNVRYRGVEHKVHEVVFRNSGSMSFHSTILNGVKDSVCDGYNAAVLSVEAPNSDKLFRSPIWPCLSRLVRGVLQRCQTTPGRIVNVTAALGFFHNDKVRDLFDVNDGRFETMQVQPSPIYGPRIPQLRYSKVTSSTAFDEILNKALTRAGTDPVLSTTDGVVAALLLIKQSCVAKTASGRTTCDVLLSSLVFASSGSNTTPYESAISRARNEYSMLFHLVLGGPSHTCFLLSLSAADESGGNSDGEKTIEDLLELHDRMYSTSNYPLRNGSVTRFVKYLIAANKEGAERLKRRDSPEGRSKLEHYMQEQTRLLNDATKMLKDAETELGVEASRLH